MKLERCSDLLRVANVAADSSARNRALEICSTIEALPDPKLKRILTLRYVNGWTWTKVGIAHGTTEAGVRAYARRHCPQYGLEV